MIVDKDLSRTHAELRRGWDGVTVIDLGSKNGTRVDGVKIGSTPVELHDGAALALGDIVMRFHDPAERHLRGDGPARPSRPAPAPPAMRPAPRPWPAVGFAAIAVLALAALIWILAT